MLGRKVIAVVWMAMLVLGSGARGQESNPKLTGQDPNSKLSKATLWIGSGSDRRGASPSLNLLVFTKDHKTKLASLQKGELCSGACTMQTGESSKSIPATIDATSATYQDCQGYDSFFYIDSNEQDDPWTIDWVKVQLEFVNGAKLDSYTKVNRALGSTNSGEVMQKVETTVADSKGDNEGSVVQWSQRPAF
jgi:hypothetical protein